MYTCSKTYLDIPFAHRQHSHGGHCSLIHGHNWRFTFSFGCKELDKQGFVVDFGKLKFIRTWLEDTFDHAYVYNQDDEETEKLIQQSPKLFKAYKVESCSAEGLAKHVFEIISKQLKTSHGDRVQLLSVTVSEDQRNSAEYSA